MKKSLLIAAGVALAAIAVSVFVYVNNGKNEMDDLFYANVEALADSEGGGDLDKCNGCSTEDRHFCCHLVIVNVGGWFLYRD